ncbi:hypothetical protein [Bosea sp. BIWAKO-01]|uniref:hypothetical protein n=1 Tax=Bosea sp. BIWAKO-01 TaxID=506668 RepID=UPI0008533433|nr:hypothetical protein [Bosea sp. BIWAKO-01]GAU85915.1 hypothetical protein BIWAKO_05863 [Bosea sp. BIWAKO-01]
MKRISFASALVALSLAPAALAQDTLFTQSWAEIIKPFSCVGVDLDAAAPEIPKKLKLGELNPLIERLITYRLCRAGAHLPANPSAEDKRAAARLAADGACHDMLRATIAATGYPMLGSIEHSCEAKRP